MRTMVLVIGLLMLAAVAGCSKSLTLEELALLEQLTLERSSVQKEIASAEAEAGKYSGGLVLGLIQARVETLKLTDALLQQRVLAIQSGAPITVTSPVGSADPKRSSDLLAEIREQEADLLRAREEAAKYSGGLVHAMALSTVATRAQTIATLKHAQLVAKYGLANVVPAATPDPVAASTPELAPLTGDGEGEEGNDTLQDEIVRVRILKKEYAEQSYQDFIFFDLEFSGVGLDRPTRAIKGTLNINDLFGERKLGVSWTIELPMTPNGTVTEKGTGFKYNQFQSPHQWVRSTKLADMTATFTVNSILYEDGSRRDFE